jgi:hypothetical protein
MNIQYFLDVLDGCGLIITDWELLDQTLKEVWNVSLEDSTDQLHSGLDGFEED